MGSFLATEGCFRKISCPQCQLFYIWKCLKKEVSFDDTQWPHNIWFPPLLWVLCLFGFSAGRPFVCSWKCMGQCWFSGTSDIGRSTMTKNGHGGEVTGQILTFLPSPGCLSCSYVLSPLSDPVVPTTPLKLFLQSCLVGKSNVQFLLNF